MKNISRRAAFAVALVAAVGVSAAAADTPIAKRGDVIVGRLSQTVSSKTAANGDKFTLVEQPTIFHHNDALKGASIAGHVENVSPAGPTHKATMSVFFDTITLANGTTMPIAAKVQKIDPPTHHLRDLGLIVGGAVAGHMAASHMGTKHGGLAGAAAGFALASTMKSNIVLTAGSKMTLQLSEPLVATAAAN